MEEDLVDAARRTIDRTTDAGPGEDGVRDRQVLLDYYPGGRVVLPTREGPRNAVIEDLVPLATSWSIEAGSQMAE